MDRIRAVVLVVVLFATISLGHASLTWSSGPEEASDTAALSGPTVIATQDGELVAYEQDGSELFYADRHTRYNDVDPVPNTSRSVIVGAADEFSCYAPMCFRYYIKRVNLTTGEREVLYETTSVGKNAVVWHDIDRIGEHRYLVADIKDDRVFVLDTSGPVERWGWSASMDFGPETAKRPMTTGGRTWTDWTHLNDVEQINETTVMVSMRNHDSVVFVHRDRGMLENLTLGSDENHDILNAQHNPDYIPDTNGGPAIVVADSTNDRVVEYQRRDGNWSRTWTYTDSKIAWPRDADRLPSGNTLISDSNANRVIEVDEDGDIISSISISNPYDAERLGTGPESAGGPAASQAGLQSVTRDTKTIAERIKEPFPTVLVHAMMFITPEWVGGCLRVRHRHLDAVHAPYVDTHRGLSLTVHAPVADLSTLRASPR
jgi:hypothetical protein